MAALLNENDWVEVKQSNCGYTGPGQLIALAHGSTWLVRIERDGASRIISVKAQWLRHTRTDADLVKKKR
jgi:hypothetical protein